MSDQQVRTGPKRPRLLARLGRRRAIAVVAALVLLLGGLALWALLAHSSDPSAGEAGGQQGAGASTSASGRGTGTADSSAASLTGSATTPGGSSGSGSSATTGGSSTAAGASTSKPGSAPAPTPEEVRKLKEGQWLLYSSRLVSPGTVRGSGAARTIDGVLVRAEAQTLVGGRPVHAIFDCGYTAQAPVASPSGPWQIFGTWALAPDEPSNSSQHYVNGVSGAVSGTASAKPPSTTAHISAGVTPIGAYRPRGVITGGSFEGNSLFEGVLLLPSVGAPPPPK